jgi:hypothetical protein
MDAECRTLRTAVVVAANILQNVTDQADDRVEQALRVLSRALAAPDTLPEDESDDAEHAGPPRHLSEYREARGMTMCCMTSV